jgi:hypothetical protein
MIFLAERAISVLQIINSLTGHLQVPGIVLGIGDEVPADQALAICQGRWTQEGGKFH